MVDKLSFVKTMIDTLFNFGCIGSDGNVTCGNVGTTSTESVPLQPTSMINDNIVITLLSFFII